jgi:hypothetical protein
VVKSLILAKCYTCSLGGIVDNTLMVARCFRKTKTYTGAVARQGRVRVLLLQQHLKKEPTREGKNYGGDKSALFKPWVSRGRYLILDFQGQRTETDIAFMYMCLLR